MLLTYITIAIRCLKSKRSTTSTNRYYRPLALNRYTFFELIILTNSFKDKLGEGGYYGSVYKGKLLNGRLVAVKVLNASKGNGEEFVNEVAQVLVELSMLILSHS